MNALRVGPLVFLLCLSPLRAQEPSAPVEAARDDGWMNCFAVVAGKDCTVDGSVIVAHNEDSGFEATVHHWKVPATQHADGAAHDLLEGGSVPRASRTPGYLWCQMPGLKYSDTYFNEHGVAVVTNACKSREDQPDLTDGGITLLLRRIVGIRATSARHGVELATELLGRFGYGDSGRCMTIADGDEAWILDMVRGKHWAAARVPDDRVAVVANHYSIHHVDPDDSENFLLSPGLIEYAIERGWYDPERDGAFDFATIYGGDGARKHRSNIRRAWRANNLIGAESVAETWLQPTFIEPARKIDVRDLMGVLRDHYEGTEYDKSLGYELSSPNANGATICAGGTSFSTVFQLRGALPPAVGGLMWIAPGSPGRQRLRPLVRRHHGRARGLLDRLGRRRRAASHGPGLQAAGTAGALRRRQRLPAAPRPGLRRPPRRHGRIAGRPGGPLVRRPGRLRGAGAGAARRGPRRRPGAADPPRRRAAGRGQRPARRVDPAPARPRDGRRCRSPLTRPTPVGDASPDGRPEGLMPDARDALALRVLRLAAGLCLAGWAWQHVYWEGPYGVLFWQQGAFELASGLGSDWDGFVGSGADDGWVQRWVSWMAWPYLVGMLLAATARRRAWAQLAGLLVGAGALALLAYALYVADRRQLPTLVEHGGQVLSPVLLVLALVLGVRHRMTVALAVVAVVLVFAGHGAFALGLWPTPATFHGMTTVILGTEHETTTLLLRVAGALDLAVCVGLLFPRTRRGCALYAATWGLITALARPVAGMSPDLNHWGADQFVHEALLRAPHAMIPLFLFLIWRRQGRDATVAVAPAPPTVTGPAAPPAPRTIDRESPQPC